MSTVSRVGTAWSSTIPFDTDRVGAAAIYCSDGRYNEQFDEFLHKKLDLPRYDRLVVPGGPGAMAGHISAHRTQDALEENLRFLIDHHKLDRVVLIAHKGCGFYLRKLFFAESDLRQKQEADLSKAAARIQAMGNIRVEAYFADLGRDRVVIEPVKIDVA